MYTLSCTFWLVLYYFIRKGRDRTTKYFGTVVLIIERRAVMKMMNAMRYKNGDNKERHI